MKSSETGGPRTKNSSQRRSARWGRRLGVSRSHFFRVGDELIEGFAPSLVEAHLLVSFAAFFIPVHREGRICCPASLGLERENRRKDDRCAGESVGRLARRTITRSEGNRPHELSVFDNFKI